MRYFRRRQRRHTDEGAITDGDDELRRLGEASRLSHQWHFCGGDLRWGSFSTVVKVDADILREQGQEAAKVHGITEEEIATGPSFADAWQRFLADMQTKRYCAIFRSNPQTVASPLHALKLTQFSLTSNALPRQAKHP